MVLKKKPCTGTAGSLAQEQQVLLLSLHQGSSSVLHSSPCSGARSRLTSALPAGGEYVALAFRTIALPPSMCSRHLTSLHSAGDTAMPVIVESDSRDSYGGWGIIGRHLRDEHLEEEEEDDELVAESIYDRY